MFIDVKTIKILSLTAATVAALLVSCDNAGQSAPAQTQFDPENEAHQMSYVVGYDAGKRIGDIGADFDVDVIIMAMKEAISGAPAQFSDSAIAAIDRRVRREQRDRERQKRQNVEEANLASAIEFLENNKNNEGVIVTESGLQYIVLKEGTGATPGLDDKVRVHYHGTILDGTVFDSSLDRDPPILAVTGVIKGWTEMLQLMKVGSKVRVFMPPELAYSRRGARAPIGPNMALIFEIELLNIEK